MYFIGYLDSNGNGATKYNLPFVETGKDEDEVDSIIADLKEENAKNIIVAHCDWDKFDKIMAPGDNRPITWQMLYVFQDEEKYTSVIRPRLEMECDLDKLTFMTLLFNIGKRLPKYRIDSFEAGMYEGILQAIDAIFEEVEIYELDIPDDED